MKGRDVWLRPCLECLFLVSESRAVIGRIPVKSCSLVMGVTSERTNSVVRVLKYMLLFTECINIRICQTTVLSYP